MSVRVPDAGMILSKEDVLGKLAIKFPHCTIMLGDARFAVPKIKWLREECFPAFKDWMQGMGVYDWKVRHDCDDKADGFKFFCQSCFVRTDKAPACDGFAVGRVWYHIDGNPTRGHAINWVITDAGLVYVEPQNPKIIDLNDKEIASRFFIH